jgi:hypothetical protein
MDDRLGPECYTSEKSERVYAVMAARAGLVIRGGHSAIVDGVYGRIVDRAAVERVAADAGVLFAGFWLEAPQSALIARVQQRRHDPSDADADVVRLQSAQPIDDPGTWRRVDASRPSIAVREDVESALAHPGELRPF